MYGFCALLILFFILAIGVLLWPLRSRKIFYIALLTLPPLMLGLYLYWGGSLQVEQYRIARDREQKVKQALAEFKNPEAVLQKLTEILRKHPKSARGWYLMGRLYYTEARYQMASDAFSKAYHLHPQNFKYAFQYLQSRYMENDKTFNQETRALLTILKKRAPENPELLSFLALDAYTHGHKTQAIHYWRALLPHLKGDPKAARAVLNAINKS